MQYLYKEVIGSFGQTSTTDRNTNANLPGIPDKLVICTRNNSIVTLDSTFRTLYCSDGK